MTQISLSGNSDAGGAPCPSTDTAPSLVIVLSGQQHRIPLAQLDDENYVAELETACQNEQDVVFDISGMLVWPNDYRWLALELITRVRRRREVWITSGGERSRDLLAVVLGMLRAGNDVEAIARGVQAAVEAVALDHPTALEPACNRILERVRDLGLRGYAARDLLRQARHLARGAGPDSENEAPLRIRAILPDAPICDEAIVPPGWRLNAAGIQRINGNGANQRIAGTPVMISRRLLDISDATESVELVWLRDGVWQRRIFPRTAVASSSTIVDLSGFGLPVTTNNGRDLVAFFTDYEETNLEYIPRERISQHMGWLGEEGCDGFLWGRELIGGSTSLPVIFQGADAGDERLAEGFHAAGTFEGWLEAIRPLSAYPRAQLTIYAASAAVTLTVLRSPNFIFSLSGPTTQGKTSALMLGASCWGCPDLRQPAAAIAGWDSTPVWIERSLAVLKNLPLCLDDTKVAKNPRQIVQAVYDGAAGRGRGRGSLRGLRDVGTWRTVLLSTGESPMSSFSQDGGTRARIVEVWGSPFHGQDEETGILVNQIVNRVLRNYGHAGPRFVAYLIAHRHEWQQWRDEYAAAVDRFRQLAGGNAVAGRMASHLATLEVTARLSHAALGLPWTYNNTVENLWHELTSETVDADQSAAALRHVHSWCLSHQAEFFGRRGGDTHAPATGWAGRWDMDGGGRANWGYLGLFPSRLNEILSSAGYEPTAIRRNWLDRGWLLTNNGKPTLRVRLGGAAADSPATLVAILRTAIEEVEGADEVDGDDGTTRPAARPTATVFSPAGVPIDRGNSMRRV